MRQAALSLVVVLALATVSPVRGQIPIGILVNDPNRQMRSAIIYSSPRGAAEESLVGTLDAPLPPARFGSAVIVAGAMEQPEVRTPAPSSELLPAASNPISLAGLQLTPGLTATQDDTFPLLRSDDEFRPVLQVSGARPMFFAARRDAADPAQSQPANLRISGVFTYKYTDATTPAAAGDENYKGPGADNPSVNELSLELGMTLTLSRDTSVFVDLNTDYTSDSGTVVDLERGYLDARDILGVRGLGFRIGRDAVRLGPTGLLLEEVLHDDDRRDGVEVWLPQIGPIHLFGLLQYALEDWSTTRRVWAGRAEALVAPGWTLGFNVRGDTASAADAGMCPGTDCATGGGFGADLEGTIIPGVGVTLSYASYTQTADIARAYYQAVLTLDLDRLAGMQRLQPLLTLWYKNFDPYSIPGGDGTVPRGGLLTPDDFHLFNINDNLTAVGSRLDLQLLQNLAFFALGEWGNYKNGGPGYNVYSGGLRYSLPGNVVVKLTYNTYTVAGGIVTTSPVSGLQLSDARVWQVELTKNW